MHILTSASGDVDCDEFIVKTILMHELLCRSYICFEETAMTEFLKRSFDSKFQDTI